MIPVVCTCLADDAMDGVGLKVELILQPPSSTPTRPSSPTHSPFFRSVQLSCFESAIRVLTPLCAHHAAPVHRAMCGIFGYCNFLKEKVRLRSFYPSLQRDLCLEELWLLGCAAGGSEPPPATPSWTEISHFEPFNVLFTDLLVFYSIESRRGP